MLTADTKRHIDSARQVLVGQLPNPMSQIQEITNALIYKFMDDMDEQSAALGGKRKYFTGEYAKYGWRQMMSPTIGAQERLNLYQESLRKMQNNPGLPPMFQQIFQNAYLPFNDPRTLTLFLKEIDYFDYKHSEELGNAYEYLLSIMGSQGDAGQFRTPRHIIDFIVKVVDPSKDDKILDPACGSAGFLISSFKHILAKHDGKDDTSGEQTNSEVALTADEKKKLYDNFKGYDIDSGMVKLSRVNMFLHGFINPKIIANDTLSSEDYWEDRYDVIMANPPFMTPKGGIVPHNKFSVKSNRAEVLFVDYIMNHLKPSGRAGIIVPEGIIFQSGTAYKQLRKNLVEDGLYCVVSLPSGVFNPYAGVKTSILLLDNEVAKTKNEVLFVKVVKDGYDLGAQRRRLSNKDNLEPEWDPVVSDLPSALNSIKAFKNGSEHSSANATIVEKQKFAEDENYNLNGDRYRHAITVNTKYDIEAIDNLVDTISANHKIKSSELKKSGKLPIVDQSQKFIAGYTDDISAAIGIYPVVAFGDHTKAVKYIDFDFAQGADGIKILKPSESRELDTKYLFFIMSNLKMPDKGYSRHWSDVKKIEIPLPPIEVQKEIVAELDGYKKIIDAAQTIVETYKPTIKINPKWDIAKIDDVAEFIHGITFSANDKIEPDESGAVLVATTKAAQEDGIHKDDLVPVSIDKVKNEKKFLKNGDLLISVSNSANLLGRRTFVRELGSTNRYSFGAFMGCLRPDEDQILPEYMSVFFGDERYKKFCLTRANTTTNISNLSWKDLKEYDLPLPPKVTQREIVAELEAEQRIVDANKKLIEIYQKKIKDKISEIWGE